MKKFLLGILAGIVIAGVALLVLAFAAVRWSAQAPSVCSGLLHVTRACGGLWKLRIFPARATLCAVEFV